MSKIQIDTGEKLKLHCKVPYKKKDDFKKAVPLSSWNDDEKVWEVPLIYLDQLKEMSIEDTEIEITEKVENLYESMFGLNGKIEEVEGVEADLYDHQKKAVYKMVNSQFHLLAMSMGSGKCNSKDTVVLTNKGRMKIENLFNEHSTELDHVDSEGGEWFKGKNIKIMTLEDNGGLSWKEPEYFYRENFRGKLRKLTLKDGTEIKITYDHPLYTKDGWSEDFEEGDKIAIPEKLLPAENGSVEGDLAEFIGWQIAEGSENPKNNTINISKKDDEILQYISELFESAGYDWNANINDCREHKNPRNMYATTFSDPNHRNKMESWGYDWGKNGPDKSIPKKIMTSDLETKKRFLQGFFMTESYLSKSKRAIEFSTASKEVKEQITTLLREFGISIRFSEKIVDGKIYYRGMFGSRMLIEFLEEVGLGKEKELPDHPNITNPNTNGIPASHHLAELKEKNIPYGIDHVYSQQTQEPSREKLEESLEYLEQFLTTDEEIDDRRYISLDSRESIKGNKDLIKEKVEKFEELLNMNSRWMKIENIEDVEYNDYIYDLEVPETHNYVAENIYVHNTLSTISTAVELKNRDSLYGNKEILIVAPSSIKNEWKKEIEQFTDESYTIIEGTPEQREEKWKEDSFFKIMNYALLLQDDYPQEQMWGMIALDEATYIKNHSSKRTKKAKKLNSPRRYALSGTPLQNDATDIFNIAQFLNDDLFLNWNAFDRRYIHRKQQHVGGGNYKSVVDGHKNLDELHDVMDQFSFRVAKEEFEDELPPLVEKSYQVSLSREQREIHDDLMALMKDKIKNDEGVGGAIQAIHRVCNSSELIKMGEESDFVKEAGILVDQIKGQHSKIDELNRILEDEISDGDKVLVFTKWSDMAELIERELDKDCVMLHGDHSEKEREAGIVEFENVKDVMVCTDIFDMGVNFQFADYIIHMDIPWTQAQFDQRTDRIHRIGAETTKVVIDLVGNGTFENGIKKKMENKGEVADIVVDGEGVDADVLEETMQNLD